MGLPRVGDEAEQPRLPPAPPLPPSAAAPAEAACGSGGLARRILGGGGGGGCWWWEAAAEEPRSPASGEGPAAIASRAWAWGAALLSSSTGTRRVSSPMEEKKPTWASSWARFRFGLVVSSAHALTSGPDYFPLCLSRLRLPPPRVMVPGNSPPRHLHRGSPTLPLSPSP